jgi:hypothetical protein
VELVGELTAILEELSVPLPYATTSLPWSLPRRAQPRWRKHALWAVPIAALFATGLLVDWFTRDDAVAAPFQELQLPPPTVQTAPAADSAVTTSIAPLETPAVAPLQGDVDDSNGAPQTSAESLPPIKEWNLRVIPWDSLFKWPTPTTPTSTSASSPSATQPFTLDPPATEAATPAQP